MKKLCSIFLSSLVLMLFFTLLFGVVYPVFIRLVGFAFFPHEAGGSLLHGPSGQLVGSSLIAQNFSQNTYFHPRPSYAGALGYDASYSDASFFGPTSRELVDMIGLRSASFKATNGLSSSVNVPADAVMSSASGLDPHISMANAKLQMPRIAKARGISEDQIKRMLDDFVEKSWLAPESYINVLKVNLELDKIFPKEKI